MKKTINSHAERNNKHAVEEGGAGAIPSHGSSKRRGQGAVNTVKQKKKGWEMGGAAAQSATGGGGRDVQGDAFGSA